MCLIDDSSPSNSGLLQLPRIRVRMDSGGARLDAAPGRVPAGSWRVWLLPLTSDAAVLAALWRLLAADERARADAFRVSWARNQFVHVRGALRLLLGECLDRRAADIDFEYGEFSKPALAQSRGWHFNVAHSGDYALLAVARGREVGVDIERLRALANLASLVPIVLSPSEAALWQALPADRKVPAFFAAWTGKEAVAKAVGQGLRLGFPELDIGMEDQDGNPKARAVTMDRFGACRLVALSAPAGYAAALAVRDIA